MDIDFKATPQRGLNEVEEGEFCSARIELDKDRRPKLILTYFAADGSIGTLQQAGSRG